MRLGILVVFVWLFLPRLSALEVERVLRIYDVADLLESPRDLPPPALGVSTTATPDAPPTPTPRWSEPVTPENFLLTTFESGLGSLIRDNSEWRSGHLLALNATEPLHRQVERTLASARDQTQLQVRMNFKLVLMDPHVRQARFPLARLDWKPIADQPGLLVAELAPVDLDYVTTNLRLNSRPSKELETTHYPLLSLALGQLGHIAQTTQLVHRPMALTQGRITAALTLGDTIAARVTTTPDRGYLTIDVEHRRCTLVERRTFDFGTAGTAELPIVWQSGERIRHSMPVGNGLIIATSAYLDGKSTRSGFFIIRPELRTAPTRTPIVTIQSP